jgi:hypothetical protein
MWITTSINKIFDIYPGEFDTLSCMRLSLKVLPLVSLKPFVDWSGLTNG